MMPHYEVTASCLASAAHVYELLIDASTWPKWSPIDSFKLEPAVGALSPDADVRVFRTGRNVSRERVIQAVPQERLVYEILSGSRLLRNYRGQIDLMAGRKGGTLIRWRATWSAPLPGLGLFMQWYLRRFQQRMVDGLARYADS